MISRGARAGGLAEISAVVFDLFITLTDFEAERRRPAMLMQLGEALGVDASAFAKLMRDSFTERATGRLGDLPSTLRALCRRIGIDPSEDQVDAAVELRLKHELEVLSPRQGVPEVLGAVRARGRRVGVITDCSSELPDLWPSLPYSILVDAVVFSCQVGHRKPHPFLYEEVTRLLGVEPRHCLYVGDGGSSELTGAVAAGMRAVLLTTPFSHEFRYDAEVDWNGEVIGDLGEVVRILG